MRNRRRPPGSTRCVREERPPTEEEAETVLKVAIEMSEELEHGDAATSAAPDPDSELGGGLPTAVLDKHTREKLRKLVFVALDEFSMVTADMLTLMHDALCEARQCPTRPLGA